MQQHKNNMKQLKIIGCLYGQVIGDALGTRYEFKNSWHVQQEFSKDIVNNFLPILGGGPFMVDKGQCTDDTELAFGLAQGIIHNSRYIKEMIAKKYIKWYKSGPFDIGNNTRKVFAGANNYQDVINNSSKYSKDSLSNGCLMRISPLAIHGIKIDNHKLLEYCKEDCSMTNPHPATVNAVQVYVIAVKTAILTNNRSTIFDEAIRYVDNDLVYKIMQRAKRGEKKFVLLDGKEIETADGQYMGYFGIAFQMAFYEILHGKSFYDSLVNVISQGGDTDTNGCIVGALLGALYSVTNIPHKWVKDVTIDNKRRHKYCEIDQKHIKDVSLKLSS